MISASTTPPRCAMAVCPLLARRFGRARPPCCWACIEPARRSEASAAALRAQHQETTSSSTADAPRRSGWIRADWRFLALFCTVVALVTSAADPGEPRRDDPRPDAFGKVLSSQICPVAGLTAMIPAARLGPSWRATRDSRAHHDWRCSGRRVRAGRRATDRTWVDFGIVAFQPSSLRASCRAVDR